jgi:hypothetical protein
MTTSAALRYALLALATLATACRSQPPDPSAGPQSQHTSAPPPSAAVSSGLPSDAGTVAVADAAVPPPPPEEPLAGPTFTKEVQGAFRVAACAGDDAWIPATVDR